MSKPRLGELAEQFQPKIQPVQAKGVQQAPPSRAGKKTVIAYFSHECVLQLKQIGLERGGMSQQDMLAEALNDFFQKHSKTRMA